MAARAAQLTAAGNRVFDFSAGEPDFRPPTAVREAAAAFVRDKPVRYTPVAGMPALREAVAAELSTVHGVTFGPASILVSCGAKHSIANLLQATVDPGDEVIIPVPAWVSYPEMARLAGGTPVLVPTRLEDGWRMQPAALAAAITSRTRWLVLNSPCNPTGAGYDREQLRQLASVMADRAPTASILADDIYRRLTYPPFTSVSLFDACRGITDRIAVVDGVSKTYAMTGFRIGYLAAPVPVVAAATRIQEQTTSGAATPSQVAALAALSDPGVAAEVAAMREAFVRRRELMLAGLRGIEGLRLAPPDGAFYMWVDVSAYLGRPSAQDDVALATWLLERHHVAIVPGSAFAGDGHIRLSYATDDATITNGCARLADAFAELAR